MFNADLETMMDNPNYKWPRILFPPPPPFFLCIEVNIQHPDKEIELASPHVLSFDYL